MTDEEFAQKLADYAKIKDYRAAVRTLILALDAAILWSDINHPPLHEALAKVKAHGI